MLFRSRDSDLTADNRLRLAGFLGHEVQDWPTAIAMSFVRGSARNQHITDLQRDPRYLATVYPAPKKLKWLAPILAGAAWSIEGSVGLSQSLMYSVIRHESRFYPRAISPAGALGLFQFMPWVFDSLDNRWDLLDKTSASSSVEYLLDPARSTQLWARWVNAEFSLKNRHFASGLMKHQAGSGNVRRWEQYWKKLSSEGDLEYRVETARFNETRNFLRWALLDTAIIDAAGFFDGPPKN